MGSESLTKAFSSLPDFDQVAMAYNWSVLTYSQSQRIDVVIGCFAFMFTNLGDVTARLGGAVIYPNALPNRLGDSRSISGHKLDLFKGSMNLSFEAPTAGVAPLVEIIQLFYTDTINPVKGRRL